MFCEFTKKVAESEIYNECSYIISVPLKWDELNN